MEGRKYGQVFVEFGEYESKEAAESAMAKVQADPEWQALTKSRVESGTVVNGSLEVFMLASFS